MIRYLAKKYLIFLVFVVFLMTVVTVGWAHHPLREVLPKAVLWGGFAAAFLVDIEFRRKDIWPLFDNLRLSKYRILGSLVSASVLLFAGMKIWM